MSEPIIVGLPDGSTVAFPAGTPDALMNSEIEKWWAVNQPKPAGPLDVLKQGASDFLSAGPAGPIASAVDRVAGTDMRAGLENLGTGAIKGAAGLASLPRTIVDAPANIANWANRQMRGDGAPQQRAPSEMLDRVSPYLLPDAATVQGAITQAPNVLGMPSIPMRTATTSGGRLAQDVGQAIGGAPAAAMMPFNLAAGAGSWGAGELTGQNPWAKALGSLLGIAPVALAQTTLPNAAKMLRSRVGMYDAAALDAGEARQAQGVAAGVPLMAQEALDTTRAGPMAQLAGNVAAQPQGRALTQFAADRVAPGGAIPTAIEDSLTTIAPRVANPNEASRALGTAADAAVMEPQIARAKAANVQFDAAAPQALDATAKANIIADIDAGLTKALPGGPTHQQLTKFKDLMEKAQTVGQAAEVFDQFKAIYKSNAFQNPEIPDAVRKAIKPVVKAGHVEVGATSPEYLAGREVYAGTGTGAARVPSPFSAAVDEVKASPAARIAEAQTNPALEGATGAFGNWLRGGASPATVKSEIARLNKQDPEAARNALRFILQKDADAAFKITKEGVPPPDSGVGFVKQVAGTEDARAALIAAVEGVTGNATTARGFGNLLEIIQRTGVTPGIGSPTAGRGAAMNEAGQGGLAGAALQGANLPRGSVISWLQNWNETARAGRTWGELAEILKQPDSVAQIRQLALMNPQSAKAQALAATILQGAQGVRGIAQ